MKNLKALLLSVVLTAAPCAAYAQSQPGTATAPFAAAPLCSLSAQPGQPVQCVGGGLTKFTTSGCSVSATSGGPHEGIFTLGANTCTVVITFNGAAGATALVGWTCTVHDRTTIADVIGGETSSTTTTASIAISALVGATDVISFKCDPF